LFLPAWKKFIEKLGGIATDNPPVSNHQKMPSLFSFLLVLALTVRLSAETIPPPPSHYFNDHAQVIEPKVADLLNQVLAEFEHETSNQILVAIYEKLPPIQ
jgi:uncharacterized membrane protein YgcG